ncbi:MAG: 6-phosphofructokinase [Chitinophagales bacterium]|jgi:6-phosphofructokinase 1|nr:6-phosphofructokinase [Sphingobacteriales bacterium]
MNIKRIGLLTSGGDSPGMNAAIRAVFKTCSAYDLECFGIRRGYQGLIENEIFEMQAMDVKQIIQLGGTILLSARSKDFFDYEGRKRAFQNLKDHNIDALVTIGGDGTFTGATKFEKEFGVPTIGIPGTIDNDIFGTDNTIGYDTALNTVMEAVDKIRDTATSHERLFFVEVMGRDAGFIALNSGIASGAIEILIPEIKYDMEEFFSNLEKGAIKGKISHIVIVAEGEKSTNIYDLAELTKSRFPSYEVRISILGHMQRGGSPTCADRVLASRLGVAAIDGLLEGKSSVMAGIKANQVVYTPFVEAIKKHNELDPHLIKTSNLLA